DPVKSSQKTSLSKMFEKRKGISLRYRALKQRARLSSSTGAHFFRVEKCLSSHFCCFCSTVVQHVNTLFHASVNPICIEPILGQKEFGIAMRDQAIRDAHPHDPDFILQAIFLQQLQNG